MFGKAVWHPRLWHLNRHSVAGAVAIGLFCGLIPGPMQMLSAALLCVVFRANVPIAVACTWYTNPLTIVPLYVLAFSVGRFITGSEAQFFAPPLPKWNAPALMASAYWDWILALGMPLAVGLTIIALVLAIAGYAMTKVAWRIWLYLALYRRSQRRDMSRK